MFDSDSLGWFFCFILFIVLLVFLSTKDDFYTYVDYDNNLGQSKKCIFEYDLKSCLVNGKYINVLEYKKLLERSDVKMINILDISYELNSFYDLAQMLLGELPTQFEFFYAICAVVAFIAFVALIFGFIGLCFRIFKGRW